MIPAGLRAALWSSTALWVASIDLNFTRSSVAYRHNQSGVIEQVAAGKPRTAYDTALNRTNQIRNSTMIGGGTGTFPNNWSGYTGVSGVAFSVVGVGTTNGMSYVDVRFSGTAAAAGQGGIYMETNNGLPAYAGQVFTTSAYLALVAGSTANLTAVQLSNDENNSSGSYVTYGDPVPSITLSSNLQRFSGSRNISGATTTFAVPILRLKFNSGAVDITIRIAGPQMEQGSFASKFIATSGALNTIDYDPQLHRVNWFKNSTMQGAVTGSPGTMPTYSVSSSSNAGLNRQVVATGTVNGMPYIDVRYSGTTTAAQGGTTLVCFDQFTAVAAQAGQLWTHSCYAALVGGTLANVTLQITVTERGSDNSYKAQGYSVFVPTSSLTRYSTTRSLTQSTATAISPEIQMGFVSGAVIDFTLRIAGPQIEHGSVATPFVANSGAIGGVTDQPRGTLIEPSSTNNLVQSNNFSSGSWSLSGSTVSNGPMIGPDGQNATGLVESTANAQHLFQQAIYSGSGPLTASVYAAPRGRQVFRLEFYSTQDGGRGAFFNLVTGAVLGIGTGVTATAKYAGNGFWRCTISYQPSMASGTYMNVNFGGSLASLSSGSMYTGDNTTQAIWVSSAQVEYSDVATSYIPTTSSAATRSTELVQMPIGVEFNPNGQSLLMRARWDQMASGNLYHLWAWSDGTLNNRLALYAQGGGALSLVVTSGGVTNISTSIGTIVAGREYKVGVAFSPTQGLRLALDGQVVTNIGSYWLPTLTTRHIAARAAGDFQPKATIVPYIDTPLGRISEVSRFMSAAELQAYTS